MRTPRGGSSSAPPSDVPKTAPVVPAVPTSGAGSVLEAEEAKGGDRSSIEFELADIHGAAVDEKASSESDLWAHDLPNPLFKGEHVVGRPSHLAILHFTAEITGVQCCTLPV